MQVLLQEQSNLLQELEVFSTCLLSSNMLILKQEVGFLECQFLKGGLAHHVLPVRSKILSEALQQLNAQGIIEGASFMAFKYSFGNFSLHVKAKQLYSELCGSEAQYVPDVQQLAVA